MPAVLIMRWEGVTPELYDRARAAVNWEGDQPPGGLYRVAAFDEAGLDQFRGSSAGFVVR